MTFSRWTQRLEIGMATFVAILVVAEVLVYYPPAVPSLSLEQKIVTNANGTVTIVSTLQSGFPAHLTLTNLIGDGSSVLRPIDYYYDGAYPTANANPADWFGLPQHLKAVSESRGLSLSISYLDANQLAVFLQGPPSQAVLMLASGALPDTVYGNGKNLLLPWIQAGGIVAWAGAPIGAYFASPLSPYQPPSPATPVPGGTSAFLNASWLGGNSSVYNQATSVALSLGVDYRYAFPGYGLNINETSAAGGFPIGYLDSGFTNIARIPIGLGALLDISAPSIDVVRLSYTLLNLLQASSEIPGVSVLSSSTVTLAPGEQFVSRQTIFLPSGTPVSDQFCRFVFQSDYLGLFGSVECIPV